MQICSLRMWEISQHYRDSFSYKLLNDSNKRIINIHDHVDTGLR